MAENEGRKKRSGAVALSYKQDNDRAPKVTAKGQGLIADKIIDAARQAGVPIYQDPGLLEMLLKLELGREIPAEVYHAVAEVLAYVRRIAK